MFFNKPEKSKLYRESALPADVVRLPIRFDIKLYSAVKKHTYIISSFTGTAISKAQRSTSRFVFLSIKLYKIILHFTVCTG